MGVLLLLGLRGLGLGMQFGCMGEEENDRMCKKGGMRLAYAETIGTGIGDALLVWKMGVFVGDVLVFLWEECGGDADRTC